jgi:hypothetical protein
VSEVCHGISLSATLGLKRRFLAAGWHVVVSATIGCLCAGLIFFYWFPQPFAELAGGTGLVMLLLSVDIVLGPVLTMVAAAPSKPPRVFKRDLALIVVVQALALGYGLSTVMQARPLYLVFEVDRFNLVTAADLDPSDLSKAAPEFRRQPLHGVKVIGLRELDSENILQSVQLALDGKDLSLRPELWRALNESHLNQMQQRSIPIQRLKNVAPDEFATLISMHGKQSVDLVLLPVVGRWASCTAVVDGRTGQIVDYLPVDPF